MLNRFEDFVGIISSIHKKIEKIKKDRMKEFGLSGNHVMCMVYLAQNPEGLTATDLCKLISVDKAATSRALSELFEKGYVHYPNLDGHKKYRTVVALTENGFKIAEQIDSIICNIVNEAGNGLSDKERCTMYRSLEMIDTNLNEITGNM